MLGSDLYDPGLWSNFFVLVGTGSAALTGLVFVAISVNLKSALKDATHTYRAINMLSGFTAVFILSSFALMGHQTNQTLGLEWLLVSLFAAAIKHEWLHKRFQLRRQPLCSGLCSCCGRHRVLFGSDHRLRNVLLWCWRRHIRQCNRGNRQFLLSGFRLLAADCRHVTRL